MQGGRGLIVIYYLFTTEKPDLFLDVKRNKPFNAINSPGIPLVYIIYIFLIFLFYNAVTSLHYSS